MEVATMATIELGNIQSKLVDASIEAIRAVDTALAVPTPNYHFSSSYKAGHWDGMTRFYKVQTNRFPTGLLSQVVRELARVKEPYEIVDKRDVLSPTVEETIELLHEEYGSITLRDYQHESVKRSITATRGVVNIATNGGKTEVACGIMQSILGVLPKGKRIVFFTHAKEIFYQSHKRIEERLGMKVGLVGDEIWDENDITVVMIPTVGKYLTVPKILPKNPKRTKLTKELEKIGKSDPDKSKRIRDEITLLEKEEWVNIKAKVKKTKALLDSTIAFIADEVHHAASTTWYDVFMKCNNAYFRFGLTGTVDEDDPINLNRLLGCTGKIIIKISNQFLIDNGYSAKPTVYMIDLDCEEVVGGDYRDAYDEGIIHNHDRNMAFSTIIAERANSQHQCLIIVNETSHGENISELLETMGIESVFTHGKRASGFREDALEGFKTGAIRVLIATPILDEGVDVSGINCLFLMAAGKSMRQLLQRIGRGLRKKADGSGVEVFDCLDYHNEYLAEHTLERYNTYKAEGFEVIKLEPNQA
jgi:superfamily II DNA or RNA helicase